MTKQSLKKRVNLFAFAIVTLVLDGVRYANTCSIKMTQRYGTVICYRLFFVSIVITFITSMSAAQTGGSYDLSHAVIASGGGSNSTGGTYSVDGTAGQAIAGTQSSGATLSIRGGFWAPQAFAPTAASVWVGGRILTPDGAGIRNVAVTLTDLLHGEIHTTLSSTFGYYRFENVRVGQQYVVSVRSNRYSFEPDARLINLVDEVSDLDFTAISVP